GARGRHRDRLPPEVAVRPELRRSLDRKLGPTYEDDRRKRNLLLPLGIVCRRPAFEIDRSVDNAWNPGLGVDGHVLHLDRIVAELGSNVLDDFLADLDRITDRLPRRVQIRERDRRVAVADDDCLFRLDLLERPGELSHANRVLCAPRWQACLRTGT